MDVISVNFLTACIFVLVFILTYLLFVRKERYSNLPPGPKPYPLIGNFLELAGKDLRQVFKQYRERYGNIFTVRVFGRTIIVVGGYEDLKEVFVKHGSLFSERPKVAHIGPKAIFKGGGILHSSGDMWKHNRRFTIHTLRDFGMGKSKLQTKIHEEISHFLCEIEEHEGQPFNIKELILSAIANVICSLVFGERYEYNDKDFLEYGRRAEIALKSNLLLKPAWTRYIPGDPLGVGQCYESFKYLIQFYSSKIQKHREDFDENNLRDFIDVYIQEMKEADTMGEPTFKNDDQLLRLVHDLFMAGSDTTATAITFGLEYLSRDTGIQSRLYDEIRYIVSDNILVGVEDKKNMPFMEATIYEILRRASIAPFGVPHAPKSDVHYQGYVIPKSAVLFPYLESVLLDDKLWENPLSFSPERFLDENQNIIKTEKLIPFSIGPRLCPGEALAKMEMHLFLSAIIQRFEILPAAEDVLGGTGTVLEKVDTEETFNIRAIKRVK